MSFERWTILLNEIRVGTLITREGFLNPFAVLLA